ncbi:F-box only protein 2-like [Polyodon spathula]|nr:F-box only protein 2-like [Polyodon spathula]XP_041130480.1 F-box only protein 2-like [Polyodon spathula]
MSELSEEMVAELLSLEKRNLIQNPHGAEQFEGWEITENGGSQWRVEELPGDCGKEFPDETVQSYFATSFELCLKKQLVDLQAEGYSEELLDTVQPKIMVQDWYAGRSDCGCTYQLCVSLLNESQEIVQEFKPDPVSLDPENSDCSWNQMTHTFEGYGPGVRFVSFEHGGQDTKYWDGWFGVRVTNSSVEVQL